MCTDISVCAARSNYAPPEPSNTPLYKYLQSKSKVAINPIEATAQVNKLLDIKQCYTYAILQSPKTYSYNNSTRAFKIPTSSDYEYVERELLNGTNLG